MQNARLAEAQTGIKIAGRKINNLRYRDDATLMAESEEEEPLDEGKRWVCKSWLKTQHSKNYVMSSGPITSRQADWGKEETATDFIFLGSKITADSDCSQEIF